MKRRTFIAGVLAVPVAAIAAPLIPLAPKPATVSINGVVVSRWVKSVQMSLDLYGELNTDIASYFRLQMAKAVGDAVDRAVLGNYQTMMRYGIAVQP